MITPKNAEDIIDAEISEQQNLGMQKHEAASKAVTTSTQARIDAVADLTKTALAKAGTLQLTPDESKALLAEFPDSDFQPGAAGKEHLLYIEHAALRDRFNSVLGLGQWAIIVRETWNEDFETQSRPPKAGVRVYTRAMLLVRGCYVAEAVGNMDYFPHNAAQNYGDAFEGAKTAAFRRCAKEFGIGLQAWRKDFGEGWKARRYARMEQQQAEKFPPKTEAKPNGNGDKPLKERIAALSLWLHGQLGVDDAAWVVPYLRSHTADGSEKNSALMPNEDLDALSETSLSGIRADTKGFIERIRAFAKANDQIPGVEVEPQPTGPMMDKQVANELWHGDTVYEVTTKSGETKGKPWTLFGIKAGKEWFNTFSKTIADAATKLQGEYVRICYETTPKGKNAIAIDDGKEIIRASQD